VLGEVVTDGGASLPEGGVMAAGGTWGLQKAATCGSENVAGVRATGFAPASENAMGLGVAAAGPSDAPQKRQNCASSSDAPRHLGQARVPCPVAPVGCALGAGLDVTDEAGLADAATGPGDAAELEAGAKRGCRSCALGTTGAGVGAGAATGITDGSTRKTAAGAIGGASTVEGTTMGAGTCSGD
jgi:hypothetical protein